MKKEDVLVFNINNKGKMVGGYTDNPKTIQEKLRWLNINDIPWSNKRNIPLKSVCSDKILLREYCTDKIGKDLCVPIIKIYEKPEDINFNELPKKFVIKTNHNSGGNIICKDKDTLDKKETLSKLNTWLKQDYTFRNGFESHYHWIERKCFSEKFMGENLIDYKFWCFNGEPQFILVVDDRYSGFMHFNFYDINFNKMSLEQTNHPASNYLIQKPTRLNDMIEYARILSKEFKFVSVDFYEINNNIYLGELTFVPGVAVFRYKNHNDDIKIGNMLKL